MGCGPADGFLVAGAMDIDVAVMRVHGSAPVEAWLQALQPEDARGDAGRRKFRLRCVADDFAALEHRPRGFAGTDFFGDAMQAQRRAIGTFRLADAETRCGAGELSNAPAPVKKRKGLVGDADSQNKGGRNDALLAAGD